MATICLYRSLGSALLDSSEWQTRRSPQVLTYLGVRPFAQDERELGFPTGEKIGHFDGALAAAGEGPKRLRGPETTYRQLLTCNRDV